MTFTSNGLRHESAVEMKHKLGRSRPRSICQGEGAVGKGETELLERWNMRRSCRKQSNAKPEAMKRMKRTNQESHEKELTLEEHLKDKKRINRT